jgi:hypothetical protein
LAFFAQTTATEFCNKLIFDFFKPAIFLPKIVKKSQKILTLTSTHGEIKFKKIGFFSGRKGEKSAIYRVCF